MSNDAQINDCLQSDEHRDQQLRAIAAANEIVVWTDIGAFVEISKEVADELIESHGHRITVAVDEACACVPSALSGATPGYAYLEQRHRSGNPVDPPSAFG